MTLSLQIASVAALLIVGGLAALRIVARDFDHRYGGNETREPSPIPVQRSDPRY